MLGTNSACLHVQREFPDVQRCCTGPRPTDALENLTTILYNTCNDKLTVPPGIINSLLRRMHYTSANAVSSLYEVSATRMAALENFDSWMLICMHGHLFESQQYRLPQCCASSLRLPRRACFRTCPLIRRVFEAPCSRNWARVMPSIERTLYSYLRMISIHFMPRIQRRATIGNLPHRDWCSR